MDRIKQIRWRNLTTLLLVVDIIDDEPVTEEQTWQPGDKEEAIILSETQTHADIQFSDGSIAYYVNKDLYTEQ